VHDRHRCLSGRAVEAASHALPAERPGLSSHAESSPRICRGFPRRTPLPHSGFSAPRDGAPALCAFPRAARHVQFVFAPAFPELISAPFRTSQRLVKVITHGRDGWALLLSTAREVLEFSTLYARFASTPKARAFRLVRTRAETTILYARFASMPMTRAFRLARTGAETKFCRRISILTAGRGPGLSVGSTDLTRRATPLDTRGIVTYRIQGE
jgi:hypothetical protein